MGKMKGQQEEWRSGKGKRSATTDEFLAEVARETSLWDSGLWALPAVRSYLKRIGAEPIGLRKARITEWDSENYKEYEVTIAFFPDSSEKEGFIEVTCAGDKIGHEAEYEPFPDELSAIYNARHAIEWPNPTYVSLDDARTILDGVIGSVDIWPKGNLKDNIGFPKFAVGSYVNLGDITDTDNTDPVTITPIITQHGLAALELRKDFSEGGKICQVFQPYDDGMWYVESGRLPLVGLPMLLSQRGPVDVVLVEGPKDQRAALKVAFPDLYCKNDKEKQAALDNPWSRFLNGKVVLSYLKGAGGVRVTDWSVISGRNVRSLTIICDNDDSGRKAAYRVSEALCKANFPIGAILHYPSGFPDKWGFADGFSAVERFESEQERKGNPLLSSVDWRLPETMVADVTWLTYDYWGKDKKGEDVLKYGVRSGKPEHWVYIADLDGFTDSRQANGKIYKAENLERRFNHRKHYEGMGLKVQGKITSNPDTNFGSLTFAPGNPARVIAGPNGQQMLNRWQPLPFAPIEPDPEELRHFRNFLDEAIPDPFERYQMKRMIATQIAYPERKHFGAFMYSRTQGTGKSALANMILKPMVGPEHFGSINGSKVGARFNATLENRTLWFADETDDSDMSIYNKIKDMITEDAINIEKKGVDEYSNKNFGVLLIASNRAKSVFVEMGDRRLMIVFFRDSPIPKEAVGQLSRWLRNEDGYAKLLWWARNFEGQFSDGTPVEGPLSVDDLPREYVRDGEAKYPLEPLYIRDKENAPMTNSRRELVRRQTGKAVADMLEYLDGLSDPIGEDGEGCDEWIISFDELYHIYQSSGKYRDKLPSKEETLAQMARGGYWHIPTSYTAEGQKGRRTRLAKYRPEAKYDPTVPESKLTGDKSKRKRGKRMDLLFSPAAVEKLLSAGGCRIVNEKLMTFMPTSESISDAVKAIVVDGDETDRTKLRKVDQNILSGTY